MMLTAMVMSVAAQNEKEEAQIHDEKKDSVTQAAELNTTMSEVTVKAARTVQKVDGTWIFPTRRQLESSPNGYSLLAKLALPHIRVDEALSSITALSSIGGVQVRINDVAASKEDLLGLDMAGVQRVEFIDNPSLRYGEGVAYVINIKVKKAVSGYVLGADLTNTLTTANGNETLYGKVNRGRSELAFTYGLDYHRFRGEEYDEQATYHLESVSGGFPAGFSCSRIYTCGPKPMMQAVARLARERGIPCEVSLENQMACGLGACLCCVEDTTSGHRCVCTDGPVFDVEELKW
jgi:hypothetical protein